MAHNLTVSTKNGEAEMAYYGEAPWHGLGRALTAEATGEAMLQAAQLDWTVSKRPIFMEDRSPIDSHVAICRDDNNHRVGIVGAEYEPLQNREVFGFMDALVGEARAMYHTAGSLGGGYKVWALARLPEDLVVMPGDSVGRYLLGVNGHDGSCSYTCKFTHVRVVCQNTLDAAMSEAGVTWQVRVRHTSGIRGRVDETRRILGISLKYFEVMGRRFAALASRQITELERAAYFDAVFPLKKDGAEDESGRARNIQAALVALAEKGVGTEIPGVKGTLWGAYNAVAEYVDHVRVYKKDGELRDGAFEAALFGSGAWVKQQAFDKALALVG